jgi:hypothetical protein
MKILFKLLPVFAVVSSVAMGSITINAEFGGLRDSSGSVLASQSTLYVIIYDLDNNAAFPGGMGQNGGLVAFNSASVHTAFNGLTFAPGTSVGGDKVLKVGVFNDPDGAAFPVINDSDFSASGITPATGRSYAFYWFPGLSSVSSSVPTSSFQVGGIQENILYTGTGDTRMGMTMPADGKLVTTSIMESGLDGNVADVSRFTAITAIPEPSTLVLTLLGSAALLRRRRA